MAKTAPHKAARREAPIHQASKGSATASMATGELNPPAAAVRPPRVTAAIARATGAAAAILPVAATSKAMNQHRPKAAKMAATVTAAPMPDVTSVTAAPAAKKGAASKIGRAHV